MTLAGLPPLNTDSFYGVLSVPADATQQDLHSAYRRKALLYHPDRHSEADRTAAAAAFHLISEAYRVLSSAATRAQYDRVLARGESWQSGSSAATTVSLAELLEGFEEFENIHEDQVFTARLAGLESLVRNNLLRELDERIVEIWPLKEVPKEATFKGRFYCGAAVLTNIRILLPYTYKWSEVHGNTTTTYTASNMIVGVLHFAKSMEIVEDNGIEGTVQVRLLMDASEINFRVRPANMLKLLVAARKWGIKVSAEADDRRDTRRVERKWMMRPMWWAVWLTFLYFVAGSLWNVFASDMDFFNAWKVAASFAYPAGIWGLLALTAWWVYRLQRWLLLPAPEAFVASSSAQPAGSIAGS